MISSAESTEGSSTVLDSLKARLLAPLFRPFFLSTSVSTYRIDRPEQVELLTHSIEVAVIGFRDRIPLTSIKAIAPAAAGRAPSGDESRG